MLKEMPKVGDVLIAKNCPGIRRMGDMTEGREYEVVTRYGELVIIDDDGDSRSWSFEYMNRFTLKAVVPAVAVGLKEVPQMGDVVIAINSDRGRGGIADITKGKEYSISKTNRDGAWFYDDSHFERIITTNRLEHFTLKAEAAEAAEAAPDSVGFIEINREYDFLIGKTRLVLDVDADGLASVKALVERSAEGKYKAEIVDKIAQCQAEMDQLNALLAEVE